MNMINGVKNRFEEKVEKNRQGEIMKIRKMKIMAKVFKQMTNRFIIYLFLPNLMFLLLFQSFVLIFFLG